jgi:hypothetical protein
VFLTLSCVARFSLALVCGTSAMQHHRAGGVRVDNPHSPPRSNIPSKYHLQHHHGPHHAQYGHSNGSINIAATSSTTATVVGGDPKLIRARSEEVPRRRSSLPGSGANTPTATATATTGAPTYPPHPPLSIQRSSSEDTHSNGSNNSSYGRTSYGHSHSHALANAHLGPPPPAHIRAARAMLTRPTLSPLVGQSAATLASRGRTSSDSDTSPLVVHPHYQVTGPVDGPRSAQPSSSLMPPSSMVMPTSLRSVKPVSPPLSAPGGHPNPSLWRTSPHSQVLASLECVGHAVTGARRNASGLGGRAQQDIHNQQQRDRSPLRSVSATSRTATTTGYAHHPPHHHHANTATTSHGSHSLGVTPSGSTATLLSDGSRSHLHPHPPGPAAAAVTVSPSITSTSTVPPVVPRLQIDAATGASLSINTSSSSASLGAPVSVVDASMINGPLSSTRRRAATTGDTALTPTGGMDQSLIRRRARSPNQNRRTPLVFSNGNTGVSIPSHAHTLAIPNLDSTSGDAPLSVRSLRSLSQSPSLASTGIATSAAAAAAASSGVSGWSSEDEPARSSSLGLPGGGATISSGSRSSSPTRSSVTSGIASRRGGGDKEPSELQHRPWNFGAYSLEPPPPLVGERSRRASGSDVAALKYVYLRIFLIHTISVLHS